MFVTSFARQSDRPDSHMSANLNPVSSNTTGYCPYDLNLEVILISDSQLLGPTIGWVIIILETLEVPNYILGFSDWTELKLSTTLSCSINK